MNKEKQINNINSILKKSSLNIPMLLCGIIITSLAVSLLTLPNKIVAGGVSGLSTLLYYTLKIEPGLSNAAINIFLLLIGLRVLGKRFIIATGASSLLLSLFVQIFTLFPPITQNPLLASVFGGLLYGLGVGLALASGGSTGGTDILGRLLQNKFSYLPIGQLIMIVDGIIIFLSLVFFGDTELALYGIITLMITTFSMDTLIRKLNVSKLAFVVTNKGDEIASTLVETSHRGVTVIDSSGAYTREKNKMLVCALKNNELPAFQHKILQIDPNAFIIFSESSQIIGNGFHVYR